MAFLQYMDSFAMVAVIFIIFIMTHRIFNSNSTELTLWFAGTIFLAMSVFLLTTGKLITKVGEESVFNPFYIAIIAMTVALMSSGYLSLIDKSKKIAPYYTVFSLILGIIVGYVAVYAGVTAEILFKPLFLILLIAGLAILLIAPIIAVVLKKSNIHSLWSTLGWAALIFVGWTQYQSFKGALGLEGDTLEMRLYVPLAIGFICLALDFGLTEWKFNKACNDEAKEV